jgi:transposase
MIKKRLAISLLLKEGKRKKHISEILDVSRTTINLIQKRKKQSPFKWTL